MRKSILIAPILALALTGCATSPVDPDLAEVVAPKIATSCPKDVPISKITVVRDSGYAGSGVDIRVSLDGEEAVRLRTKQKATMCVDGSQNHFIGLTAIWNNAVSVPIFAKANVENIIRTGFDAPGAVTGSLQKIVPLTNQ